MHGALFTGEKLTTVAGKKKKKKEQVLNADANKSDPNGQSIHLTTYNNISINLQLCWIFKSVLELIKCDCAYFLICNMMMWHVEIEGVKLRFYNTSL